MTHPKYSRYSTLTVPDFFYVFILYQNSTSLNGRMETTGITIQLSVKLQIRKSFARFYFFSLCYIWCIYTTPLFGENTYSSRRQFEGSTCMYYGGIVFSHQFRIPLKNHKEKINKCDTHIVLYGIYCSYLVNIPLLYCTELWERSDTLRFLQWPLSNKRKYSFLSSRYNLLHYIIFVSIL